MECRVVGSKDTAIEVGALLVLLLDGSDVQVLDDLDGNDVLARHDYVGHVELSTDEGTLNTADLLAVDEDIRLPVDTIEVKEQPILLESFRQVELVAIPEIGVEERLGDIQYVGTEIRVGDSADVLIAGQYRTRNGRYDPVLGIEGAGRDLLACGAHFRGALQAPVAARQSNLLLVGRRHGRWCRYQAAFTHHLQFAQQIVLAGSLLHEDTYVTGVTLDADLVDQSLTARQGCRVGPLLGVVGGLDFTLCRFLNPVQFHLVEC